jgi:hypothetical protein
LVVIALTVGVGLICLGAAILGVAPAQDLIARVTSYAPYASGQPTPFPPSLAASQHAAPQPATACTETNRASIGKAVVVAEQELICGHVSAFNGNITVLGRVDGDVTAVGGGITISGDVEGSVTAINGDVDLLPTAHVSGDIQTVNGEVHRDDGAYVGGTIRRNSAPGDLLPQHWLRLPDGAEFPWLGVLFWALAGSVVVLLFPHQLALVRQTARRQLVESFFTGLLVGLAGILVTFLLVVTCLGIPIALLVAGVLWVGVVVGTVALGYLLGMRLLGLVSRGDRHPLGATLLGVTLLTLLEAAPCVGGVLMALVSCTALGASSLTLLRSRRSRR